MEGKYLEISIYKEKNTKEHKNIRTSSLIIIKFIEFAMNLKFN